MIQFTLPNPAPPYRFFRFEADTNWGDGLWQIGEVELFAGGTETPGLSLVVQPGAYNSTTQTLTIDDITGIGAGEIYHLRSSSDGQTFAPLAPGVEITDLTTFPLEIPVNVGNDGTLLLQLFDGASP